MSDAIPDPRIDTYIESMKDEMLRDIAALVKIDSQKAPAEEGKPYGAGAAAALAEASAMMERYGLKVTNYDNYVVAGDYPADTPKALDVLAHLDVVPVTDDWTVTKPFTPLVKDGRIYGRGTSDDKGPAVAALYAIRAIKELGIPLKKSVRLILGSDEECGSSDLDYYYQREEEAPYSFTPDADFPVINLEKARLAKTFSANIHDGNVSPRVLRIASGDKVNVVPAKAEADFFGFSLEEMQQAAAQAQERTGAHFEVEEDGLTLTVYVKGRAAHASLPENGLNAMTALLDLIASLDLAACDSTSMLCSLAQMFPHGDTKGAALGVAMSDEISGGLTLNPGILQMDDDVISGAFDIRAPLCATDENLTEVIREKLATADLTMEAGDMTPAHYVPADTEFVRTLLDCYEMYSHKPGKALAIGGGTYVHELKRGVAFGCDVEGIDTHMHGDDEFMDIDVLMMSAKIFAEAIIRVCNMD